MHITYSTHIKEKKSSKLPLIILFLVVVLITGYHFYNKKNNIKTEELPTETPQDKQEEMEEEVEEEVIVNSAFTTIDGQEVYIAKDLVQRDHVRYPIVIYSHGSTYTVSKNPNNPLTNDLDLYADIFVNGGYIFAASNQHGDNWGNSTAIEDTKKLIQYLEENYNTNGDIYLLGFSMGGLVTLNYAEKYPANIKKIALLAPTSYANAWNSSRVAKIMDIPIKIWHGDKDVNVPYSMTANLVKKLQSLDKTVEVVTIPNVGHFDVDTEYTQDVLNFFNEKN
ncbi:MAG: alpha/beta fold hydrolase [Candidatus Dojkabacteria bacterium]|jgi:predicted esterase